MLTPSELDNSLQELEQSDWGNPTCDSHLVTAVHPLAARRVASVQRRRSTHHGWPEHRFAVLSSARTSASSQKPARRRRLLPGRSAAEGLEDFQFSCRTNVILSFSVRTSTNVQAK